MAVDKYGTGQDSYCYDGSTVLRNKLNIIDEDELQKAEQVLTELSALDIELKPPLYDLSYLCGIHQQLFEDVYEWAGQIRTVDISKKHTRFCNCNRIEPEADKLFQGLDYANYYTDDSRQQLVAHIAELYAEINMIHPFREGNGRAQRILFEHIVINCGYEFSLASVTEKEWIEANIAGADCDYKPMEKIFDRCIGDSLL